MGRCRIADNYVDGGGSRYRWLGKDWCSEIGRCSSMYRKIGERDIRPLRRTALQYYHTQRSCSAAEILILNQRVPWRLVVADGEGV